MTQGIQAKVATWLGHIKKFRDRPLNAKTTPASAPPARKPSSAPPEIHAHAAHEQMQQTKKRQQPRQRQQQVNERWRIKRQGVELGEKRAAAATERIPPRQFSFPKTLPLEKHHRIAEQAKIPHRKSVHPRAAHPKTGQRSVPPARGQSGAPNTNRRPHPPHPHGQRIIHCHRILLIQILILILIFK